MASSPLRAHVFKTAWSVKAELATFRELAKGYEKLTVAQLTELVTARVLEEICHGDQA